MGLIEIASGNSVWRGMDYYENHKVVFWNKSGNSTYEGVVSGSNGDSYNVYIDKLHPRKSVYNCSIAGGRRVLCKHNDCIVFLPLNRSDEGDKSRQTLSISQFPFLYLPNRNAP